MKSGGKKNTRVAHEAYNMHYEYRTAQPYILHPSIGAVIHAALQSSPRPTALLDG